MNIINSEDFWDGWDAGFLESRIEAFGAIRRAAEVARFYDNSDTYNRCDLTRSSQITGNVIRNTIRVAIKSKKKQ